MNEIESLKMEKLFYHEGENSGKNDFFLIYTRDTEVFAHRMYMLYNNQCANTYEVDAISADKVFSALKKKYANQNLEIISYSAYDEEKKNEGVLNFIWRLKKDLYVACFADHPFHHRAVIFYSPSVKKEELDKLKKLVGQARNSETDTAQKIYLLCQDMGSLDVREFELTRMKINLPLHYGDSILATDALIKKQLAEKAGKGLVLLYGKPGTGKTSYIRYLTKFIKKKLIYVPPQLANDLSSPQFLPLLAEHPNSVLVIEDAENILQTRSSGENAAVSNLLNLADGLLSDCLNIQIICSFNTDLRSVDTALLRKGRLIASYEFIALEIPLAQKLSNHLGFKTKISKPMTLAEIYNQQEADFDIKKKEKIGF